MLYGILTKAMTGDEYWPAISMDYCCHGGFFFATATVI